MDSRVHLEIGSRVENVELVQIAVEASLREFQVDDEVAHWVGTAVREAVANAIKHGTGVDPDKKIEIDFGIEGEEIVVQVRDDGSGFDPENLPDPLTADNLLKPNGRGIFLMKKIMDKIEYNFVPGRGTELTLRKRLQVPSTEPDQIEEEER
jgi:serine/threonine-protein kinase RsbW